MDVNKEYLLGKLESLNADLNEKGNFIIDLGKHDKDAANLIVPELINFFVNDQSYYWVRHASISVLLKDLRIQNEELLAHIKKLLLSSCNDTDLVTNCLSGLGVAFFETENRDLIIFLYKYSKNENMDISHRCSALVSCLNLLGYSIMTIVKSCGLSLLSDYSLDWLNNVNFKFSKTLEEFI